MVSNGILHMSSLISTVSCDMFCYRTMGEMQDVDKFNVVTDERIESWSMMHIDSRAKWVFSKAQVCVDVLLHTEATDLLGLMQ